MRRPTVLLALCSLQATAALAAEKPCTPVARAVEKRICAEQVGTSGRELLDVMWVPLFEEHAKRNKLQPTADEIKRLSALFDKIRKPGMEPNEIEADFIRSLVLSWKVGRDLHRRHGGRVSLSSFGFNLPIEGMQAFLKEEEKRGSFEIHDAKLREAFWQEVMTGMQGDGIAEEEEGRRIYAAPPWEARPEEEAPRPPSPWKGREGELQRIKERVRGVLEAEGRQVDFERLRIVPGQKNDLLEGRVIYENEEELVVDISLCSNTVLFFHLRRPYFKRRAGSQKCGSRDYETFIVTQE